MFLALCCAAAMTMPTDLRLAPLFQDSMVLQRETRAPVWGEAEPGARVRIRGSWSESVVETVADGRGAWLARIETPKAGGPFTLEVNAGTKVVLQDVLVGEVWLCSGQSNMEWKLRPGELGGIMNASEEIAKASFPRIRHFDVGNRPALRPERSCNGRWSVCSPETAGEFSAVAYFFARELNVELDVPIGMVNATWSGTRIEAWLDDATARRFPDLAQDVLHLDALRAASKPVALDAQVASVLFNGMVEPLAPFALRGFLWYQGESNRDNFATYSRLQPAMVDNLRARFEGPEIQPFLFVQIAPFAYEGDVGQTGAIRDVQRRCLAQPHTGMAVTMDIGDPADIHPANKQEVGRRLALWALCKTYGREKLVFSGPLYREHTLEGAQVRVRFDSIGEGLIEGGDHITGFEIAGDDRKFVRAQARIDGDSVIVWAQAVPKPVAVRYGFGAAMQPILFNKSWLPAAAFRTDDWPIP
ncbi:MAG: 9-O-acetylesterase [Planctomycetaceae bacterium]|nr:9-O-acetylesterase [Planctomycetaceae bacterium]